MTMAPPRPNPFPGLRPFTQEEDYLFFGREEQTVELLQRLGNHRFVAVVGTSGSGKSSLVRCGLLSELLGGRMLAAGASWEVAITHPGGNPLGILTDALLKADLYDRDRENAREALLATLSRSHFGLVEAVRQASLPGETNFLLVVDQFEEIFRFHEAGEWQQEAANEFISLLLEAAAQRETPIYIVLTMRSDFIGECGEFEGLAEMVNRGEFLIPRLTREQYKRVIDGPIKVAGGQIAPRLLQRLLNDLGQQADQLPCLQHALMRTWEVWAADGEKEAIDLDDYQRVGRMSQALSLHADEIYSSLPSDRDRDLCRGMFQALTVEESAGRGIRRPQRLGKLCQILEVPAAELTPIIDAYRRSGVTFLMPAPGIALTEQTIIDISHESLMRVWIRLRQWVEEETQAAGIYHRLAESAGLQEQGKAGLYRDPELGIALAWREASRPNAAWAERYRPGFAVAIAFLERSQQASVADAQAREAAQRHELEQAQQLAEARQLRLKQQQRSTQNLRRMIGGLAVVAVIAGVACVAALIANQKAETQAENARQNATRAEQSRQEADQARASSETSRTAAETSRAAAQGETYRSMLSEISALRAGHQLGWRAESLAKLARLAVMPTLNRDLVELRSQAVASMGELELREVARLDWPKATVNRLAFSADSKTLAAPCKDGDIHLWDVSRRSHVLQFAGARTDTVAGEIQFLPDGSLAIAANTAGVVFCDASGQPVARRPLERGKLKVSQVIVNRGGDTLLVRWDDGRIDVLDAATGTLRRTLAAKCRDCALNADGKQLVILTLTGSMQVVPTSGEGVATVLGDPGADYRKLTISPDGETVACVEKRTLVLWDVNSKRELMRLGGHKELITGVAFSPDSTLVATTCGDSMTRIWDARDSRSLAVIPGPWYMRALAFSPDGNYIAASAEPGPICLYKLSGRREQRRLVGHSLGSLAVAFHPHLPQLVSGADDSMIITWEPNEAQRLDRWKAYPRQVTALAYSPDGSILASACGAAHNNPSGPEERAIKLWDAKTREFRKPLLRSEITGIWNLAFDPTGRYLASGDDAGLAVVWDVETGKEIRREKQTTGVTGVAFWGGGRQLLIGTSGGDLLLYNLNEQGAPHRLHLPIGSARMIIDARRSRAIVGDYRGAILAVSLPDLKIVHRLADAHEAQVAALCLSPDGRLLASSGRDRRLLLRDASTFEPLLTFPAWTGVVRNIAFDPTGRWLALAGSDSDVDLWDLDLVHDELAAINLPWDPTRAVTRSATSPATQGTTVPVATPASTPIGK